MLERMIASDGSLNLYKPGNLSPVLVRKGYASPHRNINNVAQFKGTLRAGPYAWPGGYEFVFVCNDGASMCYKCAYDNAGLIMRAIHDRDRSGWHITGMFLAGHDSEERLTCDNCNRLIQEDWRDRED
jgi:hypothetical protein